MNNNYKLTKQTWIQKDNGQTDGFNVGLRLSNSTWAEVAQVLNDEIEGAATMGYSMECSGSIIEFSKGALRFNYVVSRALDGHLEVKNGKIKLIKDKS